MFSELARLLDELAGQEVTHALRLRRHAHLLEVCGHGWTATAHVLRDYAQCALLRSESLARCVERLGGTARGRPKAPPRMLARLDPEQILSTELIEALAATDAFAEVERYIGTLDMRARQLIAVLRDEREHELKEFARLLDMCRARDEAAA